jgi:hypothetical protein
MSNPYVAAFLDVREREQLTPLLDAHDAERRAIETIERGFARLDPTDLVAAARDFTTAEYGKLGFPGEIESSLDRLYGRASGLYDDAIPENTRALLSVADIALGALPRELDRLTIDPVAPTANVYPTLVDGLVYVAVAGLLEKRIGQLRQERYVHAARGQSVSLSLATTREADAVASLAEYEQGILRGRLLPRR